MTYNALSTQKYHGAFAIFETTPPLISRARLKNYSTCDMNRTPRQIKPRILGRQNSHGNAGGFKQSAPEAAPSHTGLCVIEIAVLSCTLRILATTLFGSAGPHLFLGLLHFRGQLLGGFWVGAWGPQK